MSPGQVDGLHRNSMGAPSTSVQVGQAVGVAQEVRSHRCSKVSSHPGQVVGIGHDEGSQVCLKVDSQPGQAIGDGQLVGSHLRTEGVPSVFVQPLQATSGGHVVASQLLSMFSPGQLGHGAEVGQLSRSHSFTSGQSGQTFGVGLKAPGQA